MITPFAAPTRAPEKLSFSERTHFSVARSIRNNEALLAHYNSASNDVTLTWCTINVMDPVSVTGPFGIPTQETGE